MRQVLFVCTGNIFRSLTAEHALRHVLGNRHAIVVSSAGTDDRMCTVDPVVSDYLRSRGIDVSRHRRRTLTAEMLQPSVTVIAMSTGDSNPMARKAYIHLTIDRILQLTPQLASRLIGFKESGGLDEEPANARRA